MGKSVKGGNYLRILRKRLALGLGVPCLAFFLQGCAGTGDKGEGAVASGPREDVVTAALAEVGTRYAYGAESPGRALDCSALTQHAYRAAGVSIPRVSLAQRRAAKPVGLSRVKPGDLVFFKTGRSQYHVGLMVDGKRFVHASTSQKRVLLSSLDSDYWRSRLLGAGTYFN
jgi:cell wall-associated NlpC family hydrolase